MQGIRRKESRRSSVQCIPIGLRWSLPPSPRPSPARWRREKTVAVRGCARGCACRDFLVETGSKISVVNGLRTLD